VTFDPLSILRNLTQDQLVSLIDALSLEDTYLTVKQTRALLQVTDRQLFLWRGKDIGPAYIRMTKDGSIRYRLSVINAFMLLRQQQTTRLPALSRGALPTARFALGQSLRPAQRTGKSKHRRYVEPTPESLAA
jgi:hypothetical protein